MIYGMLYPKSDFESLHCVFSTESEKCAQMFYHLVKSVFAELVTFEEHQRLSKHGESVTVFKASFSPELSNKLSELGTSDVQIECTSCQSIFVRGVFIASGTISDPEKGYHLEFAIPDTAKYAKLSEILLEEGIALKSTVRRGVSSLYVKNSEEIEDFLTYIGASGYSIQIMDAKIVKEIRNNENRKSNCDAANIYKSTGAAANIIKIINSLIADGKLDGLPEQLKTTAILRVENPEMSLTELAGVHEPPITKSGLFHRLSKITAYYEKRNSETK